jgi:hypothetical protein
MPTSKTQPEHQNDILNLSTPVDYWLDETKSALVIEMALGQRLEVPLTFDEFEQRRQKGMRVYNGSKDGPDIE